MTWLQLANKTAIVTGAASGIGAAVAKALAAEQCNVVLADKNVEAMEKLSAEISQMACSSTAKVQSINCNVTDPIQVQNLIHDADQFAFNSSTNQNKSTDVATLLVNCAGITRDNWLSKLTLEDWDSVLDVNLKATFLTCQAFLDKERVDTKLAGISNVSIVNIGSFVSEVGNMGQVNYAASKGGVLGLTRSLAKEIAPLSFRANAVLPGFIDTPMTKAIPDNVKELIMPRIPLKRFGQPSEVANLVSFLLSERSSYITGESVNVCGMASL